MRVGAILLTGGMSRRMGRPKEGLLLDGMPLLMRAATSLAEFCAPILVVARDLRQELPDLPIGTQRLADRSPGAGPLAGLATGLRHLAESTSAPPAVVLAACDMPMLQAREMAALVAELGNAPLVMPSDQGVPQPLVGVYRVDLLTRIETLLDAGERSLRALTKVAGARLLTDSESRAISPSGALWRNVNTPAELLAAEQELRGR